MRVLYFLSCVFASGGRKYWSSSTCVGDAASHTHETGTPARGPCARTGSGRPRKRGTPRRRSGRASSCTRAATSAPAAALIRTRRVRRSSGPGRRGTYRRRCRCASCTWMRRLTLYFVALTDAGPRLPLLLEGLRLGVAGPRVGLGEREGREVRRQGRERVLLVGRGRGSRGGGGRLRPWRFRFGRRLGRRHRRGCWC